MTLASLSLKQASAAVILTAFLALTLISLDAMMYTPDGRMQGDCPLPAMGASICPQNAQSAAVHHISAYQSLLSVQIGPNLTALVAALLLALVAALIFSSVPFSPKPLASIGRTYHPPPVAFRTRKITHWLSLFENSPSFA